MSNSIRPSISINGGRIIGGVGGGGIIGALIYIIIQLHSQNNVAPNSKDATQDILIQHNKEAIAEIKSDIKESNTEVLEAIKEMRADVGVLKARIGNFDNSNRRRSPSDSSPVR